jgi:hypothetical protein
MLLTAPATTLKPPRLVESAMALVLSERDYKLVTIFTKVAGMFLMAAGSMMIVDYGRIWLGLGLLAGGIVIALAPVPMTVLRPDTLPEDEASNLPYRPF